MQEMGCPDAVTFASRELQKSWRRARELIAAGRALLELKQVDRAGREGEICWSAVRVLIRAAEAQGNAWFTIDLPAPIAERVGPCRTREGRRG